jgi:membrane protease YdiL (CAAX protease family)
MTSSRRASSAAAVLGALAVLASPGAVLAAQVLKGVPLLRALYVGVPVAVLLALLALLAARRARLAHARSVYADTGKAPRLGRFLAWAGVYAAVIGVVALGVYGALRASG